jgi:hypothetical protein
MIFLSEMKKNWCAFKIWFLKLLRRKMSLPTIRNEGQFIDPVQVTKVTLVIAANGEKHFFCLVNGIPKFLTYTAELEGWFESSKCSISETQILSQDVPKQENAPKNRKMKM